MITLLRIFSIDVFLALAAKLSSKADELYVDAEKDLFVEIEKTYKQINAKKIPWHQKQKEKQQFEDNLEIQIVDQVRSKLFNSVECKELISHLIFYQVAPFIIGVVITSLAILGVYLFS